jgi:hypothetical protein
MAVSKIMGLHNQDAVKQSPAAASQKPNTIIVPHMESVNGSDTTFCVFSDKYNFNELALHLFFLSI